MGYFPPCSEMFTGNNSEESSRESGLDGDDKEESHGFFEVDDIVEQQINSKTHEFEYRLI